MPPIDLTRHRAVVFDVDGTLYDQRRLRRRMVMELVGHCLAHPRDLGLPRRLQVFRRERERLADGEAEGIAMEQYLRPAAHLGVPPDALEREVFRWMEERPLRHLAACRSPGAGALFRRLRAAGVAVAVLSDYPAEAKLAALGLTADLAVAATDPGVGRFKPHPAGLLRVLGLLDVAPERCVVVGDRDERDGEAARRVGADFLLKTRRPAGPGEFRRFSELLPGFDS